MFTRGLVACSRRVAVSETRFVARYGKFTRRRYSSSAPEAPVPGADSTSAVAALSGLNSELDKLTPRFNVNANQIQIIKTPTEFYETLKAKISKARNRIFLATLYIGKNEKELVQTIRSALQKNPRLRVSIMTDFLRGTREFPKESSASLLVSLVKEFPKRVEVRLYHTPNLTGLRKWIIPNRINEGWGLQHMKLYGVDDEIIMSGANLSDDYFTNRQDRYHLISSAEVTNYFARVYRTMCSLSYRLEHDDTKLGSLSMDWPTNNAQPSPLKDPAGYIKVASKVMAPLLQPSAVATSSQRTDTVVYPLLQLTPILKPDTSTELPGISLLLRTLGSKAFAKSSWTFTAGYFNMSADFRALLLATSPARGTVVAASPWANGFYGSKGISGMLPAAYTHLAKQFLHAVKDKGLSQNVALKEWRYGTVNEPGGWTYHAKGLWITLPGEQNPSISLIGSSNYTKRSYSLDLEANTLIVTRNQDLMKRLGEEERWLQEHAKTVDESDFQKTERRVGLHVRIAMWIVTLVGGAL